MKQKLVKVEEHLKQLLKNPHFREVYELDRAKTEVIKKIIGYRIKRHLTQGELARKVGVTQQQISKIENGEFSNLTTVQKILLAIGYHLAVSVIPLRRELQVA